MKARTSTKPKKSSTVKDLTLLISVPLVLAGLLAAIVYIPQLIADPTSDFVYSSCDGYACSQSYKVKDGVIVAPDKVELKDIDDPEYMDEGEALLYYYDVTKSSSRPISEEEAKKLKLDSSTRSEQGYQLIDESNSANSLFSDGYGSSWVLQDGIYRKKINLVEGEPYTDSIKFIGWVK